MPAVTAVALSAGTWLTTDAGTACFDEKPARKSRFSWPAGAATITDYVTITATFANASTLSVFAALGLSLPAGVRVVFVGHAGAALGSITDQRTVTMPDGSAGVFGIGDESLTTHASAGFRIYNDANGSPWATTGTPVDIGELVAMPGVSAPIRDGWAVETVDPSEFSRTRGGQVSASQVSAFRVLTANMAGMPTVNARGGGLSNGMDIATLAAALRGGARCVAIPHYRNIDTKALDGNAANRSGIYGYASQIPDVTNISRGYFASTLVVEEVPAR